SAGCGFGRGKVNRQGPGMGGRQRRSTMSRQPLLPRRELPMKRKQKLRKTRWKVTDRIKTRWRAVDPRIDWCANESRIRHHVESPRQPMFKTHRVRDRGHTSPKPLYGFVQYLELRFDIPHYTHQPNRSPANIRYCSISRTLIPHIGNEQKLGLM